MGRQIEDMGTLTVEVIGGTVVGYFQDQGSLAPKGFGGHVVVGLISDSLDNSITLTLETAAPDIATIDLGMNYRGVANSQILLTSADGGLTFTGIDIDMASLLALAADAGDASTRRYPGIETFFKLYDATPDLNDAADPATDLHQKTTEHGAWNQTPVHEEGSLVRVGSEPRAPVCYPNHRGGWDSANLSSDKYPLLPGQPT